MMVGAVFIALLVYFCPFLGLFCRIREGGGGVERGGGGLN